MTTGLAPKRTYSPTIWGTMTFASGSTLRLGSGATLDLTGATLTFDTGALQHGAEVDNPSSGVHGVTGSVVGTTDTQTLTNKTLSNPTISGTATVAVGAALDVSAGTLTLANDQVSGDKINGGTISNFASTGIDDNATSTQLTVDDTEATLVNRLTLSSVDPIMYFKETDGATNNKIWALAGAGQDFVLQPRTDAGGASGRYIKFTRASNNQLAQMQFLTAGSAWAYFDNTTQTFDVTGGTVNFPAGTAASVPGNFTADNYLTLKANGTTIYIPYRTSTW